MRYTSDGHIDDTNIQLLGADGSTVIAQNDNARHGSYMEYTAPDTMQDATVKVLPMQRSMRGSYQLYVSTTQPDLTAAPPPPGGTTPPPPAGGCGDSGGGSHVAAYSFNGNADDGAGSRHGVVYGATLAVDRFGKANSAYYFGEQSRGDMITVPTPFTDPNSDFTISLWIAPAVVGDGTWHGFVGYSPESGDWQDRSPGLWLDNQDGGQACGMHYDSRHNEEQTRWAGAVPDWFNLDTYVHTLWTGSAGDKYTFYKNGAAVAGNYPAPATFSLHDSYTIGRVGCANDDIGCFGQQPVTGTIDQVEFYDYRMGAGDVGSKYASENSGAASGEVCGGEVWNGVPTMGTDINLIKFPGRGAGSALVSIVVDKSHTSWCNGKLLGAASSWNKADQWPCNSDDGNYGALSAACSAL